MKVAAYRWEGQRHVGLLSGDDSAVTPLALGERGRETGTLAFIEHLMAGRAMPSAAGPALPLASVQLDAPLPKPRRNLFCVGRNYRAHAKELSGSVFRADGKAEDAWPIVFTKVPECVIAPGAPIRLPRGVSEQIDYEAELAVVIGRGGSNIRAGNAMDHVFGYTIVNDVTARDVQMRHQQWDLGKSFDSFCPMGPFLVSADACDARKTHLRCWVNGALRQEAETSDLIFDIPTLIETCSRGITLYPGDIIATGTPAGVGMGMTPPTFLRTGDVVRIEINGIGVLENPVQ
jgi:2-keto-4-pentenoate hydratase/2-oxohepta-3-ene-1,7-dioic acid hydratase in catechol pathway